MTAEASIKLEPAEHLATSGDEFLAAARKLVPALAERAAEADALRRVPERSIEDLHNAGLFRMLQPTRFGGAQAEPKALFDVEIELARGCPSTGWVLGVVAVHSWQLALFPERAQQDVWADDPGVVISSSYAPVGKIEPVDGGFRVSGRWSFSSGCDYCQWVFLGGWVPPHGGFKRPDMRTFLLPRSDYEIVDTWHVCGLRGSGSKDIVVDNAFVPEYRTHRFNDGFKCESPGNEVNPAPVYRLPFGQIHVRSVSSPAIGAAQGALDAYCQAARRKVSTSDASKVADDPTTQIIAAEAAAAIDRERVVLHRNFDEMMGYVLEGRPIPIDRRIAFRFDSSNAAVQSVRAVDALFTQSGGRALFLSNPLHRFFVDAHAIRAHFANNPDKPGRNFGRAQLGMDNQDFFI